MIPPPIDAGEVSTAIMAALALELDWAYHDGTPERLAIASEAYRMAGFHDESVAVAHASRDEVDERVAAARRGRHRLRMRARAAGGLDALRLLAEHGIITYSICAEARRQRWLARGGHDGPV